MALVATIKKDNSFFRSQTIKEEDLEIAKITMQKDVGEELDFKVMQDEELELWLATQ